MNLVHHVIAGFGRLRRPMFDARAAVELAKLGAPFFASSRFALAPSAMLTIVNDIVQNQRQLVLELGSGASTLHIAKALDFSGGALVTVDSDQSWLGRLMSIAREAGLAARITPVFAPISRGELAQGAWYDTAPIFSALGDRKVDLLLVDGPPAYGKNPWARRPAAAILKPCLAENFAIYLDDIHRLSHAKIAREWGRLLGLKFKMVHARGGFAYASRGQAYDPIL